MSTGLKKWLVRVLLLAVGLVAALCLGEVGIRVFLPDVRSAGELMRDYPAMFLSSPHLPYELLPKFEGYQRNNEYDYSIRLNSKGYRGPEFEYEKSGQYRIICIGDSFTFGTGVEYEESWPALLQAKLSQLSDGQQIEVINAGFKGAWYPDGYLVYLSRWGLDLDPDLVIVGLFIGNDLDYPVSPESTEDHWRAVDEEGLPTSTRSGSVKPFDGYLLENRFALQQRKMRWFLLRESRFFQFLMDSLRSRPDPGEKPNIYEEPWSDRVERKFGTLCKLLLAMDRRVKARGARMVVVMMPPLEQLKEAEVGEDRDKPQRRLKEFFQEHEIQALDLLPDVRAAGEGLYYPVDQHWNASGNRLAAELVAEYLRGLGLRGSEGDQELLK